MSPTPSPLLVAGVPLDDPVNSADPPPPYPSRERRVRAARATRRHRDAAQHLSRHTQVSSTESDSDALTAGTTLPFPVTEDADHSADVAETTPLLSPSSARRRGGGRARTLSYASTLLSSVSAAPSLAHTFFSLFQTEPDSDPDYGSDNEPEGRPLLTVEDNDGAVRRHCLEQRRRSSFFSHRAWKRYFRPLTLRAYYASLFHLLVLNFPYALAAWVYLFVFTLTGTTLLMALPLGAILCFFDLLGARMFARGELALQTRFHGPLAYPPPYPPRPIFTRLRDQTSTPSALEAGQVPSSEYETSFYKNTYAMFTDSTSYQALFYFLVIKPGITLLFSLFLIVLVPPAFVLVVPAPAVIRAVRRIGVWQANVAIEGLYMAVS